MRSRDQQDHSSKFTPFFLIIDISYMNSELCSVDQFLDKCQCLASILVHILLVRVGIVAVAAVRISGVAIRLNNGRVSRRALVSAGTGRKLV